MYVLYALLVRFIVPIYVIALIFFLFFCSIVSWLLLLLVVVFFFVVVVFLGYWGHFGNPAVVRAEAVPCGS